MENDATSISQKVVFRSDDIPLGEQTVAQVSRAYLHVRACVCVAMLTGRYTCRVDLQLI